MKHPSFLAYLSAISLTLALVPAHAQMGFSPAAPPVTNSGFNRSSVPAPLTPRQAVPGTALAGTLPGTMPGAYVAAQPGLSTEAVDPDHKLNRGDTLSYRVLEDRDDKIWPLTVSDTGEVNLPLGGRVKAVGKSTRQLTADIKSVLEQQYYYHATVDLGLVAVAPRSSRGQVYVAGAVRQTGAVDLPLDSPLTASQAIYRMGGPVDFSNLKKARVVRKESPTKSISLPVNVKAVQEGKLEQDVVLQPGDTVIVPEATFGVKF